MFLMRKDGMTLIELMIALAISVILVGGIYAIFVVQQRSYTVQDQIAAIQQDARAAINIMARDIRMAGMLCGAQFSVNGSEYHAVSPNNSSSGPDSITIVLAYDELSRVTSVNGSQVTVEDGEKFSPNQLIAFEGVKGVYTVTSVDNDILTLNSAPPQYIANYGATVYEVASITYHVNNFTLQRSKTGNPVPQPLVGDESYPVVEDLQFAYKFKEDDSWYNTIPAGKGPSDVRMVRINLLVRTPVEDLDDRNYRRPALEDHPGAATTDGYRRRVLTTVVKLRNLGV